MLVIQNFSNLITQHMHDSDVVVDFVLYILMHIHLIFVLQRDRRLEDRNLPPIPAYQRDPQASV